MAQPIIMPKQGLSVESCIFSEWKADVGDSVKKGDVIFAFETDKASFEYEAESDGVLLAKFFNEGDEVPVLANVGVLGKEDEDPEPFRPEDAPGETKQTGKQEQEVPPAGETPQAPEPTTKSYGTSPHEEVKIAPRAKKMAEKYGLDYGMAEGSGPQGRIICRDIEKLLEKGPVFTPAAKETYDEEEPELMPGSTGSGPGGKVTTADLDNLAPAQVTGKPRGEPEYEETALSNIRRQIAGAMQNSLQSTAQLTLNASFDAKPILDLRKAIKNYGPLLDLPDINITDVILFAVSRTLPLHRHLNAHMIDDKIRLFKNVHLGVAIDTERGLMVPTIFNANQKSLGELSSEVKSLAEQCRTGSINPDYLTGGTFTVTNLGPLGVEAFTPVLNPPQTGILGVNSISQRVKETDDGHVYYPSMGLSLTFDHRALDGAPAARFLKDLKTNLEKELYFHQRNQNHA